MTRKKSPYHDQQRQQRSISDLFETPTDTAAVKTIGQSRERFIKPVLRFTRYSVVRLLTLFLAVVAGLYVTLMVVELGGKIDEVRRGNIIWAAGNIIHDSPEHRDKPAAERAQLTRELAEAMIDAQGLNRPLAIRMAEWMPQGLTLQLGESLRLRSIRERPPNEQRVVSILILERIPNTLLLLGLTNLIFFFVSVWFSLFLSRRYRSWLDKLFVVLSPLSTAPSWFYGLFLIAIFAGILGWLPFGGMFPSPPPDSRFLYYLGMLERMILPFTAVFLSVFFYSVYVWRTFFLIYSSEDYVDMAQAKGLSDETIQRRYILRPTMPTIVTSMAIMLIEIWGGSIILERIFRWPGLGDLYFDAIMVTDTAVIVGLTVVYAYFLALTIFALDLAYALLDPRVRLGGNNNQHSSQAATKDRRWFHFWPFASAKSAAEKAAASAPHQRPVAPHQRPVAPHQRPVAPHHRPVAPRQRPVAPHHRPVAPRQRPLRPPFNPVDQIGRFFLAVVDLISEIPRALTKIGMTLWQLRRYPSAVLGLTIIFMLLGSIIYTVRIYPLQEAIVLWRGSESDWQEYPRLAQPLWYNTLTGQNLPRTIIMDSQLGAAERTETMLGEVKEIVLTYTFDFPYDGFPQEPAVYFYPIYREKVPYTTMTWHTPDGREYRLLQISPSYGQRHRFSQDSRLMRRLDGVAPQQALFAHPDSPGTPLQGEYQLQIITLMFEEETEFEAKFMLHGQVHGLAGTDSRRRDLMIPLLWGVPIALSFGLLAAFTTTFFTMTISAVGVWWGGRVDSLVQRLSEVNMVIPVFPVLAMYTAFFTVRIWTVLGLAILFTIFGSAIKTYRALFLQVRESPYVEAAQAYGASNSRIVLLYLVPRVLPVLIPQIMILVPAYVFLEAGLAFLGLSDVYLPTWGKVINDAHLSGALFSGHYYWILQPAFLLMLTAFAFAMLGFTLDRVFNPRLRER